MTQPNFFWSKNDTTKWAKLIGQVNSIRTIKFSPYPTFENQKTNQKPLWVDVGLIKLARKDEDVLFALHPNLNPPIYSLDRLN